MKKINFAIVGCGKVAHKKHLPLLIEEIKEADVVAVCDIQLKKAKESGKNYNLPYYTDYHQMIKKHPEIDVISILTEGGNHLKPTVDLAKYGKNILVEKPIALTLKDADKMIEACHKNNVRLFVIKQNRYNYPVRKLKEAIDQGRFGKIFMGTVRVRWTRHQDYYDQEAWRGTWQMDGGVLGSQASHHLDLLEWLVGDVESVFAKTINAFAKIEAEDTGLVLLKFKNGALGTIEATTATRPRDIEGSLSILGSQGAVEIGGFSVNEIKLWQFEDSQPDDEEIVNKYRTAPPGVQPLAHKEYLKDIINVIINNRQDFVDGRAGRKSLQLIHAIYKSIETGREVLLDSNPVSSRYGVGNK